jgi:hypothetical protein
MFKYILNVFNREKLVIFDIDNTVADTWPSFLGNYISNRERLANLKPFKSIVEIILKHKSDGDKIIFMSAREYPYYGMTKKWLEDNCLKSFDLILVSCPIEKLRLLKLFPKKDIIYYDDLSHSHEKGSVRFYKEVLADLACLRNIKHIGYNELLVLQKENSNE